MDEAQTAPGGLSGGCLCGRVRYATDETPRIVANCHCRDCQRQTGSAFSTVAAVTAAAFRVSGDPGCFTTRGESGGEVRRHFCRDCGSPLYSEVESAPGLVWLKTGTIDGPAPSPQLQLWWRDAQPWLEALVEPLPRFTGNYVAGSSARVARSAARTTAGS